MKDAFATKLGPLPLKKADDIGVTHLLLPENRPSLRCSSICAIRFQVVFQPRPHRNRGFLFQHKCPDAYAARGCRRFRRLVAIKTKPTVTALPLDERGEKNIPWRKQIGRWSSNGAQRPSCRRFHKPKRSLACRFATFRSSAPVACSYWSGVQALACLDLSSRADTVVVASGKG
jgi:hypothetical protein